MLDLFRLHSVIECLTDPTCRSTLYPHMGKTTAYQYLMLGEVWVGTPHEHYLYIGDNTKSAQLAAHGFADLLMLHGIERVRTRQNFTPLILISDAGQVFRFAGLDMALTDVIWHGTHYGRVFFDVCADVFAIDKNTTLNQLANNIFTSGADIV